MQTSRRTPLSAALGLLALGLGACATLPAAPVPPPAPPSIIEAEPAPEPVPPPGVTISPAQTGDYTVAFKQSRFGERTFPVNEIGASLVFTSNLRMPRLEAAEIGKDGFQLRMRFRNAANEPLLVSMVCMFEAGKPAQHIVRALQFPVDTFRDITMDLTGDPEQKIRIRASAVPASSVTVAH